MQFSDSIENGNSSLNFNPFKDFLIFKWGGGSRVLLNWEVFEIGFFHLFLNKTGHFHDTIWFHKTIVNLNYVFKLLESQFLNKRKRPDFYSKIPDFPIYIFIQLVKDNGTGTDDKLIGQWNRCP